MKELLIYGGDFTSETKYVYKKNVYSIILGWVKISVYLFK